MRRILNQSHDDLHVEVNIVQVCTYFLLSTSLDLSADSLIICWKHSCSWDSLLCHHVLLNSPVQLIIWEIVIHLTAWPGGLKCRASPTIEFNCATMLALGIVARIIWIWTNPTWLSCNNGISVVTRCRIDYIIWIIDHWNCATCLCFEPAYFFTVNKLSRHL